MNLNHYVLLAEVFDYPQIDYQTKIQNVEKYLQSLRVNSFKFFSDTLASMSFYEVEELFTRTFLVQSATTLDVGYILFGDDYKRGELLSHLNREHCKYKNDCRNELADHLPNILRLLPLLQDNALLQELVEEILEPALRKMISEFEVQKMKEKSERYQKHYKTLIELDEEKATVFSLPLKILYEILKSDFKITPKKDFSKSKDFLKSVTEEIEIEGVHT
ncbi:MAG: hypothetical protein HYW47_05135 [Deltaproteobacteria bacterium]|nr:hypothetical protein [Deltaproteobacteria bacterium]